MVTVRKSPGVYSTESFPVTTTESVGVTTAVMAGETLKGPAFQPVFVNRFDTFKRLFGGTSPEKFKNTQLPKYTLPYDAKSYLTQSNQLYVIRVLGLSGYDAGRVAMLRTIGAPDIEERGAQIENLGGDGDFYLVRETTGSTTTFYVATSTGDTSLDPLIPFVTGSTTFTDLDGSVITRVVSALNTYFNPSVTGSTTWSSGDGFYWGFFGDGDLSELGNDPQNFNSMYVLPSDVDSADLNDYIVYNDSKYFADDDNFILGAFALRVTNTTPIVSGTKRFYEAKFIGRRNRLDPKIDYHKVGVASLRSKGFMSGETLVFNSDLSDVTMSTFNADMTKDALGEFVLSVSTGDGYGQFVVSLDNDKKSFIKNIFGSHNTTANALAYCEESYDKWLKKQVIYGNVRGLYLDTNGVPNSINFNHYRHQYQTPTTPFFVSEKRGDSVVDLFKFHLISDGADANTSVKVSIAGIDLQRRTFDVQIRDFNDTDANPVILERFFNCTMDKTSTDFIGRKIGTVDGEYPLKSAYLSVEIAENAPNNAIPAGFRGYVVRTIEDEAKPIIGVYKTKYYNAGEVICDTTGYGDLVVSPGDKIRKAYLGFSDLNYGFDADLLKFKGKTNDGDLTYNTGSDFSTKIQGFHLDVAVSGLTAQGQSYNYEFETGKFTLEGADNASPAVNPYANIQTRKFTALFAGGFDGWDIYRDTRTNLDEYKIGRTLFTNGLSSGVFDTFVSSEDGETYGTSDYYAYLMAYKKFANPEDILCNVITTQGIDAINHTELVNEVIEIVEDFRGDALYIYNLPDIDLFNNNNPNDTSTWLYPKDISVALEDTEINSTYATTYYPWIQVDDKDNAAYVFIPPTGEVLKNLAFTDKTQFPWVSYAGYKRGRINAIKPRFVLKAEDRDTLYDANINAIARFPDVETVIFGNNTTSTINNPIKQVNVRRLILQIRRALFSISNSFIFDQNDETLKDQFLKQIRPILENIKTNRGISAYRIAFGDSPDRNTLSATIEIVPISALERIILNFVVNESGTQLTEG